MCYISSTVAGFFIERSIKENVPLSVFQLIKLTYIAHGWHLALYDAPLISERVEAWKYGPVMPSLFSFFKGLNFTKDDLVRGIRIEEAACIKPIHRELLTKVHVKYSRISGDELTNLMHEEDTPWYKVWDNEAGKDKPIEDIDTKTYYSTKIDRAAFEALSDYPSIESKEEAIALLKKAGILSEDGTLNPIYK